MKLCLVCSTELNEGTNWYPSHVKQSKHLCNACWRDKRKERRHAKPTTPMFEAARTRAKRDDLPFNLTIEDIIIPDVCPVLGIPLKHNFGGKIHDASPTLDRIIPSNGYVRGNVAVISWRANSLKKDASIEELYQIHQWLKRQQC